LGCWPVQVPNASPAVQGRGRRGHACASSRCRRRARARTAGTRIRRRSYRRGSKRRGRRPYPRRRRRPARTTSRGSEGRRWPLGLPVAGTERRRLLHGRQPLPLAWLHLGMLGCIHRSGAEDRDFRDHLAGAGGRQHQPYGRRHPTWGQLAGTAMAGSRARLMVDSEGRMPHGTGPRQGRSRICGFDAGCTSAGRTRRARLFYGVTLRARVLIFKLRPAAGSVKFEGALYDRSDSS
jgi:hypothetical protein